MISFKSIPKFVLHNLKDMQARTFRKSIMLSATVTDIRGGYLLFQV